MSTEKQQGEIHRTISEFENATLLSDKEALANDLIELISHHSYIGQVKEFMTAFKQDVASSPALPSKETMKLRLALLLEELIELSEACGKEVASDFSVLLHNKSQELHHNTEKALVETGNVVDAFDALLDIQYVLSGAVLAFGLQTKFDTGFEEVHRSNMSKACDSLILAQETKSKYEGMGTECYIDLSEVEKGIWTVRRTGDRKLLKSNDYSPANLNQILLDA
jgi:predicted HAD superfamily Cof-like phosphohydrolase